MRVRVCLHVKKMCVGGRVCVSLLCVFDLCVFSVSVGMYVCLCWFVYVFECLCVFVYLCECLFVNL